MVLHFFNYFKKKRSKGILAFIFIFVLLFTLLLVIFAVIIPFLQTFLSGTIEMGNEILNSVEPEALEHPAVNESINMAKEGLEESEKILGYLVKYSWLIILLIITVVLFVNARKVSEYEKRGLV